MRTGSIELRDFYASPLGQIAQSVLRQRMSDAWGELKGQRVAGFGYAAPLLSVFTGAERMVDMVPIGAGAVRHPCEVLVDENNWPLAEASIDRLVIVHGLEESADPRRIMREAWRVLTDDGRLILIVANRHGFWTLLENSPLAAGRAFSRRQLLQLIARAMFAPTAQASALYFPPITQLRAIAPLWERTAERLEPLRMPLPNVAGVVMIEARRALALPASGTKVEALGPIFAAPGRRVVGIAAERDRL